MKITLVLGMRVPAYPRVQMTRLKAEGRKDRVFMGNAEGHRRLQEFYDELAVRVRADAKVGLTGPISIDLVVGLGPQSRGDIDNYAKSILDGLTKINVLKDDRYVDDLRIRRFKVPRGEEYLHAVIEGTHDQTGGAVNARQVPRRAGSRSRSNKG